MSQPIAINQKIVGFEVVKNDDNQQAQPVLPDDDPGFKRIDSRPEGELNAISKKIVYSTSEGKQKVYLMISFMEVTGVLDGEEITIERPIEFFFPVGQGTSEHQWISATMRSLSLAARGGYVAQNLQDMCKVSWDKGPVRCGTNQWGKPVFHNSEVSAIAWTIQETLKERGFLDADGNQVPTRVLARKRHGETADADNDPHSPSDANPEPAFEPIDGPAAGAEVPEQATTGSGGFGECGCPQGGTLRLLDGCLTCDSCGWSKCH